MSATVEHVLEQMSGFGAVTTKKMFGAVALYYAGLIFGMIDGELLYLKGDDVLKPEYEKEKLPQFTYESKSGGRTAMSYWLLNRRAGFFTREFNADHAFAPPNHAGLLNGIFIWQKQSKTCWNLQRITAHQFCTGLRQITDCAV
jgi:TfoX/Sxy family transcriptional regulator of competence genes